MRFDISPVFASSRLLKLETVDHLSVQQYLTNSVKEEFFLCKFCFLYCTSCKRKEYVSFYHHFILTLCRFYILSEQQVLLHYLDIVQLLILEIFFPQIYIVYIYIYVYMYNKLKYRTQKRAHYGVDHLVMARYNFHSFILLYHKYKSRCLDPRCTVEDFPSFHVVGVTSPRGVIVSVKEETLCDKFSLCA